MIADCSLCGRLVVLFLAAYVCVCLCFKKVEYVFCFCFGVRFIALGVLCFLLLFGFCVFVCVCCFV